MHTRIEYGVRVFWDDNTEASVAAPRRWDSEKQLVWANAYVRQINGRPAGAEPVHARKAVLLMREVIVGNWQEME